MKHAVTTNQLERKLEADNAEPQRFCSVANPESNPHLNGEYFRHNPTWHVEYSPWKAGNIFRLLKQKGLNPKSVYDVGCGAGEVLRLLQAQMDPECQFWGYDVAPPPIEMAKKRENERLHFECADFPSIVTPRADLLLALEVVDHVEDYLGFLRSLKQRADWKIFSFSLDISAQAALRGGALLRRREVHSHLHHFSRETALACLRDTGYEIVEALYPPAFPYSTLAKLAEPVRKVFFMMNPHLTVRMLGGYSLLVLAR
jgi:SAM-dependent methyltransferase